MAQRTGIGYDIHRRAEGRPLWLGGVLFESPWGLEGHSDADVLLHAVADALLGAVALGDIGKHFPPDDPKWENASSLELLRMVRALLDGRNAKIVNVDATLIAEAPRIGPVRDQMRLNIAQALHVGARQVSVKATTNETLGALGRGEGIAALAIAAVELP